MVRLILKLYLLLAALIIQFNVGHASTENHNSARYWAGHEALLFDPYGNELMIKYSKDGTKFSVEWAYVDSGMGECSGDVFENGKLETIPCTPSGKFKQRDIGGTIHEVKVLNYPDQGDPAGPWLDKKLIDLAKNTATGEEIDRQQSAGKNKQTTIAAKAAEEKKRKEIAAKAAEEKKRKEIAAKAAEEKKRLAAEREKLIAEKKRLEVERKRLAAEKKKRKEEEKQRLAAAEKKRLKLAKKAEEQKKRKTPEKRPVGKSTASASSGGGELKQQLAVLKQLQSDGLIDEQEFQSRKKLLLDRFLGMKSKTENKVSSVSSSKNLALNTNLKKYNDVKFGNYHALVIGSNEYKHLPKLTTAEADAKAVTKLLKSKYDFDVKTILNATRQDILDAFDEYREILTKSDNLLIYYAGHGYVDEKNDRGYWMPVNARPNRRSAWLANEDITGALKALNAKHVMVVSDSCYSGTLTRGLSIKKKTPDYVREVVSKKARVVITSGGLEPVADKGGGNHSPFASVFLEILDTNNGVLDGTKMFSKMRRPVMLKSDQTPAFADVRKAGHEGGDFIFVRRR